MLSHWLERGLGQVLAPDPSTPPLGERTDPDKDDASGGGGAVEGDERNAAGGMWDGLFAIVAPDPQFEASRHGSRRGGRRPSGGESTGLRDAAGARRVEEVERRVGGPVAAESPAEEECVHCHRMTPTSAPSRSNALLSPTAAGLTSGAAFRTPHSSKSKLASDSSSDRLVPSTPASVESLVLISSRSTADAMFRTTKEWESTNVVLTLCSQTSLTDKKRKKLKKKLSADPKLVWCRATDMGKLVPDGYTPMHAAAANGNVDAAEVLIQILLDAGVGAGEAKEGEDGMASENSAQVGALFHNRNLQGGTPLHVASQAGQASMITCIKDAMTTYPEPSPSLFSPDGLGLKSPLPLAASTTPGRRPVGPDAPLDMGGRTPLGLMATSRDASAKKNRRALEAALYSPGDASVCGRRTPAKDRTGGRRSARRGRRTSSGLMSPELCRLGRPVPEGEREDDGGGGAAIEAFEMEGPPPLLFGYAEMPGRRIRMEDAMFADYPLIPPSCASGASSSSSSSTSAPVVRVGLFGVFDGHSDDRLMSRYLADNLPTVLQATNEWRGYQGGIDGLARAMERTCATLDVDMRAMNFRKGGGSTGVIAVVTEEAIIVANVGDSRCILVQRAETAVQEAPQLVEEGPGQGEGAAAAVNEGASESEEKDQSAQDVEGEDGGVASSKDEQPSTTSEEPQKGEESLAKAPPEQETSCSSDTQPSPPPPQSAPAAAADAEEGPAAAGLEAPGSEERPTASPAAAEAAPAVSVIALSDDHTPNLPHERARILAAELLVMPDIIREATDDAAAVSAGGGSEEDNLLTIWKVVKGDPVKGDRLAMSRAFGDYDFKDNAKKSAEEQAVVAVPELKFHLRDGGNSNGEGGEKVDTNRDLYLVLACDGVWDVMSNDQVGEFVHRCVEELRSQGGRGSNEDGDNGDGVLLAKAADRLLNECYDRGAEDNMTVVIVSLAGDFSAVASSSAGEGSAIGAGLGRSTATKLFAED